MIVSKNEERFVVTQEGNKVEVLDKSTGSTYRGKVENGRLTANNWLNLTMVNKALNS